jgi:hypothetical protein
MEANVWLHDPVTLSSGIYSAGRAQNDSEVKNTCLYHEPNYARPAHYCTVISLLI